MRRHPALRPLSRGHQPVLFHAREMKWDPAGALPAFLAFARGDLVRHLEAEEAVLFPAILARLPGGDPALDAAREAHAAIRAAVERLSAPGAGPADPGAVRALSRLLHDHVRDEERRLFPLAERVLGEEGLAAVARDLGDDRAI
jgi:hemerythrin-like domain-containing protein